MSAIRNLPCLPTWHGWLLEYAVRVCSTCACLLYNTLYNNTQVVYCVDASNAAAAARALSAQASTLCRLCAQRGDVQEELVVFAVPSGLASEAEAVMRAWRDVLQQRAHVSGVWTSVELVQEAIGIKPVAL